MLRKLLGLALVALLDISSGVIVSFLCCFFFGAPALLSTYAIGVFAALALDVSIPIYALLPTECKTIWHITHHRQLTHHPALVLPLVFCIFVSSSLFWAVLITACLAAHLIDDTFDPGGIAWFSPFWNRHFQIGVTEQKPLPLFEWIEQTYLRLTVKSVATVVLTVFSVVIVSLTALDLL